MIKFFVTLLVLLSSHRDDRADYFTFHLFEFVCVLMSSSWCHVVVWDLLLRHFVVIFTRFLEALWLKFVCVFFNPTLSIVADKAYLYNV